MLWGNFSESSGLESSRNIPAIANEESDIVATQIIWLVCKENTIKAQTVDRKKRDLERTPSKLGSDFITEGPLQRVKGTADFQAKSNLSQVKKIKLAWSLKQLGFLR